MCSSGIRSRKRRASSRAPRSGLAFRESQASDGARSLLPHFAYASPRITIARCDALFSHSCSSHRLRSRAIGLVILAMKRDISH
jgi:hypothetical protein